MNLELNETLKNRNLCKDLGCRSTTLPPSTRKRFEVQIHVNRPIFFVFFNAIQLIKQILALILMVRVVGRFF